ncbi:MAG: MFS transporter [Bacteroidia bacterium]|nr:MFS transporter [Bacteroidia bacterium]
MLKTYRQAFANLHPSVWKLAITLFINRSGSMVLLFASLYFTQTLHFTIAQAGWVMSMYGVGSILGAYIGGWLTDRYHPRYIMITALLVSSTILLPLCVTTSPIAAAAIVFLYALTADMFRPANSAAISFYSTPETLTRSVSLVRLAINLGFTVGPAMGGFIAMHLGYQWLFVLDACSGYAAAFMLYKYLPHIEIHKQKDNTEVKSPSAYTDLPYLFFIGLVAFYGTCFFQLISSIPQYFKTQSHYAEDIIGLLMALNGLLVVLIEMPIISKIEHTKFPMRYIICGVFCLTLSYAALYVHQGLSTAIIYIVIITLSEVFAMPFMMNFTLSRPTKDRKGQYAALYSMAYGLSFIAAPAIGLNIAEQYGFKSLFGVITIASIFLAFGFYSIQKHLQNIRQ